jgi:acyl-coenzyme A thioesterase PaaI-like protein
MRIMKNNLRKNVLETLYLRYFGFSKIPLILFVRPFVTSIDKESAIIRIPFRRRTRNHLGSMYFGAMSIGADLAGGILAFTKIRQQNQQISLIFKNFNAEFLKRAEGPTYFSCNDGKLIEELISKAIESEERVEDIIHVTATVPSKFENEAVAQFKLTLSLKKY